MSAPVTPRPRFTSIADLTTSSVSQVIVEGKTRIIRQLFALAPKRRRARVRWIVLAGIVLTLGYLARDPAISDFVKTRAVEIYRRRFGPVKPANPAPGAAMPRDEVGPAPRVEPSSATPLLERREEPATVDSVAPSVADATAHAEKSSTRRPPAPTRAPRGRLSKHPPGS